MPKTRRLSDATLVRRSQQGDRRAFTALLARYDWRLRGLANALLLDRSEMDAALGIGYLRAWRDVVRINPREDVAAWLYRVTYNACIDQLRRSGDGPLPERPRPRRSIAAGLAALPAADRVAVVLVDREGFSPASAARILGLDSHTLATTLDTARKHLTAFLPAPGEASDEAASDGGRAEAAAEAAAAEAVAVAVAAEPDGAGGPVTAEDKGDGVGSAVGAVGGNGDGKAAAAGMGPDRADARGDGAGEATASRSDRDGPAHMVDRNGDGRATETGGHGDEDGGRPAGAADRNGDGRGMEVGLHGDEDGDRPAGTADGNGDGSATASGADGDVGGDGNGQAAGVDADAAAAGWSSGHNPNRGRGRRARRRAQHMARQQASEPGEPTDGTP